MMSMRAVSDADDYYVTIARPRYSLVLLLRRAYYYAIDDYYYAAAADARAAMLDATLRCIRCARYDKSAAIRCFFMLRLSLLFAFAAALTRYGHILCLLFTFRFSR